MEKTANLSTEEQVEPMHADVYLDLLEVGYYEVKFAFDGLADEYVWKRPAAKLLSIGEIAGHIAYWEAVKFGGEATDDVRGLGEARTSRIGSPLVDPRFRYYGTTLSEKPTTEHLSMTAAGVYSELVRVHREAMEHFTALGPDFTTAPPGFPANYTYGEMLKYAVFHVAYHTGQIYTIRQLLGETPPDN